MKLTVNGKEQNVIELDFETTREEWNEYKLLDGGSVRVKTVVQRIFRVLDEQGNPTSNEDSSPNVAITSGTMIVFRA